MLIAPWLLRASFCRALLLPAAADELPHVQHPLQVGEGTVEASPLLSLHQKLVEIPSISGDEHAVAEFLSSYLAAHNFTVQKQPVARLPIHPTARAKQRLNVLAYPSASSLNASRLLLTSHLDTVPPYIPYTVQPDSQIWGRGVVDAKACVAAQVRATIDLYSSNTLDPSDGEVSLLFVVGEETGGDGMRAASSLGLSWETVIFGEPTELKLASGHKGGMAFTITAHGKGGHSGYPWLGENANGMLIPALLALEKLELPWSEKYGNTTLNIGRMSGGQAANTIAQTATADIQLRLAASPPSETWSRILACIARTDPRLDLHRWTEGYGPIHIDSDIPGFDTMTVNYGTDIPWLAGNHKRYLYGPGSILDAHSDHEHLKVEDLVQAVEGYKRLVLAALGR